MAAYDARASRPPGTRLDVLQPRGLRELCCMLDPPSLPPSDRSPTLFLRLIQYPRRRRPPRRASPLPRKPVGTSHFPFPLLLVSPLTLPTLHLTSPSPHFSAPKKVAAKKTVPKKVAVKKTASKKVAVKVSLRPSRAPFHISDTLNVMHIWISVEQRLVPLPY